MSADRLAEIEKRWANGAAFTSYQAAYLHASDDIAWLVARIRGLEMGPAGYCPPLRRLLDALFL